MNDKMNFIQWFVSDKMQLFSTIFIVTMTILSGTIKMNKDTSVWLFGAFFFGYILVGYKVIQGYIDYKNDKRR